ncbi:MAG: type II secretion system protein [Candidatus Omnitrophica bacterium]|nr:type II secretion system protein [Candidatus Omnitrophota bacterium]
MDLRVRLKRTRGALNTRQAGFTLVELLMALLIFVVAVGSAFATFQASAQLSETARNRMIAVHDAASILEEIKVTPLQNVMTTLPAQLAANQYNSQVRVYDSAGNWTGQTVPALTSEQITLSSNPAVINANTTLATFTVTVSWNDARGRALSLSLTTQKSAY